MNPPQPVRFRVQNLAANTRLDRVLRVQFPAWGRQAVQRAIGGGKVRLNGKQVRLASWEVKNGDQIEIVDPPAAKTVAAVAWDEAWIIAEEPELIVVNKPAGLLSEPTRFSPAASLLALAKERFGEVILFHRLDRDTSGLLLLTRPGPINKYLSAAFQNHTVQKEYVAVVARPHRLQSTGVIDARIGPSNDRRDQMTIVERGGQRAVTRYALADADDHWQLVRLFPETGRTHQLRVHLAHLGSPILGDRLYGPQPPLAARLHLHAERIELPAGEGYEARSFTVPLPAGFWPVIKRQA